MKVIKPIQLSFFSTFARVAGDWHQFGTVLVGWDLITGDTRAEMEIWRCIDRLAEAQIPLDEFAPKEKNEFFVEGRFYSPTGAPVRAGFVEVEVGEVCKRINVFGNRYWRDIGPLATTFTDPEPIDRVQIDWAFAYGGEGYPQNPIGKGFLREEATDMLPLPNLEFDSEQIGDPDARPRPAAFLPLAQDHPDRIKFAGTYGKNYVEEYFPGYPGDFNVEFFNRAPRGQRVTQALTANTRFSLTNLHPSRSKLEGYVPNFVARVFFDESYENHREFNELELSADTVWFFPEKEIGVLIFHGSRKTDFHDTKNIDNVVVGYERLNQPRRSKAHYAEALKNRSGDRMIELNYLFSGADLIPENEKTLLALFDQDEDERLRMFGVDRASEAAKKKAREELDRVEKEIKEIEGNIAQQNEDIQKEMQPTVDGLKATVEDLRGVVKGEQPKTLSDAEKKMADGFARMTPRRDDGSFDLEKLDLTAASDVIDASKDVEFPEVPDFEVAARRQLAGAEEELMKTLEKASPEVREKALAQFEEVKQEFNKELSNLPKAPYPRPPGQATLDSLGASLDPETVETVNAKLDKGFSDASQELRDKVGDAAEEMTSDARSRVEEVKKGLSSPPEEGVKFVDDLREQLAPLAAEGDVAWHEGYVSYAHKLQGFVPPKPPDNEKFKSIFIGSTDDLQTERVDFAGCSVANLLVANKSFFASYFESATFRRIQFVGISFVQAVFAHGIWEECVFHDCSFEKTNLGGMRIENSEFLNCKFKESVLTDTLFSGCKFEQCEFEHILSEAMTWSDSSITNCQLMGTMFLESSFSKLTVKGSRLERFCARGGLWREIDLFECTVFMTMWIEIKMSMSSFRHSTLHRVLFQKDCTVERADFSDSKLLLVNMSGLDLSSSVFQKTQGELCDFSESAITESAWIDVNLDNCRFAYSRLSDSEFNGVRFIDANMQDADLRGSKFSNCNLFSADLLHARIGDAHFSECELGRTLLQDWSP